MLRSVPLLAALVAAPLLAAPLPFPKPTGPVMSVPRDADELLARLTKGGKPVEVADGWAVAAGRVEGRVLHNAVLTHKGRDGHVETTVEAMEAGVPGPMSRGEVTIFLRNGIYFSPDFKEYFTAKEMTLPLAPAK